MNRLINLCEKHNNTILCHRKCVICEQAEEIKQLNRQAELYHHCLVIMTLLKDFYELTDVKAEPSKTACRTLIQQFEEGLRQGRIRQMEIIIKEITEENTQLQDQLDALMAVAQILANTFPEDDMSEMDASVFVDRAGETMTVVDKAKDALAKVKETL